MKSLALLPLFCQAIVAQSIAFVGNYGGTIATVQFNNETGALKLLHENNGSFPSPSWQEVSANKRFLYTIEETSLEDQSKGALTSYSIKPSGQLKKVSTALGMVAPVHLAISPDRKLIFTANYGSASVSAYRANPSTGEVSWIRSWQWNLTTPGAIPERQAASHPHQAIFDPTGKFVLVPDLGADLLRIFDVSRADDQLSQTKSINVKPGTGPRHGVFYPSTGKAKFFYVVGELSNSVTAFSVEYTNDNLKLKEIQSISTLPDKYPDPKAPAAGELILHPNGKHLYASNRLDNVFPNANSIASYEIDASTGKLKLLEIFNSGVVNVRHISIHPSGEWLITQGHNSNNIKSFQLDPRTGKAEREASSELKIEKPVCLQWWKVVQKKIKC